MTSSRTLQLPALATTVFLVLFSAQHSADALVEAGPIVNPTNGNSYYLLSANTWLGSEAEAQTLGGHLVAIGDGVENDWVWNTFAPLGGGPLWIGLNDTVQEGYFLWSSGEPYGYSSWWTAGGEPNDAGGVEDYAEINNGVWNDTDGFGPNGAVVEVEDESIFRFVEGEPIPLPPLEPLSAYVFEFAVSGDGRHVYGLYSVSIGNDEVLIYERGADGALTLLDAPTVAGNPIAMALAPDGTVLFVLGNNGNIQTWLRDSASGLLTFAGEIYDGTNGANYLAFPKDVAMSPDGQNVYVVSSEYSITSFSWNGSALAVINAFSTAGLATGVPYFVTVTPDGNFLLAVCSPEGTLLVFARDPSSGTLSYVGHFLDGVDGVDGLFAPIDLVAAPTSANSASVYVLSGADAVVATFAEGPSGLSYVGAAPLILGTNRLAVSADGTLLFASEAWRNGLSAFLRDPVTGVIGGLADAIFDTDIGVDGLYGAEAVAVSADGRNVYVSGRSEGVLGVFATPEPGSVSLGLAALLGLGAVARRRGATSPEP